MWYRDPQHPELGPMFCPDSEAHLAVPPGMVECQPPRDFPTVEWADPEAEPFDWTGWVDVGATVDDGTTTLDAVRQMSAENIAHAFGVPPNLVGAVYRNKAADQVPQAELDRRLAEQLCYWCGVPLEHDDPVDMFHSQDCAFAWRVRQTRKPDDVLSRSDYDGYAYDAVPEPGETPPSWLGVPLREARPAAPVAPPDPVPVIGAAIRQTLFAALPLPRLRDPGPSLTVAGPGGAVGIRNISGMSATWDWKVSARREAVGDDLREIPMHYAVERSTLRPDGIVISRFADLPASVAQRDPARGFGIGYAMFGRPALKELRQPPPLDRGGWPVGWLEFLQREGWRLACTASLDRDEAERYATESPCPVPMTRLCEHCGETARPTIHTAMFMVPQDERPDYVRCEWQRGSTLVCGACMLPYTGPIYVPLWREHPDHPVIQVTLIGTLGERKVSYAQNIDGRALDQVAPGVDVVGDVWGHVLREARTATTPWQCAAPHEDTPPPVTHWLALSAHMRAWGYMLTPRDEEPLIMGLCPYHMIDLHHEVLTNAYMYERMAWHVRANVAGIHIQ